MSHAIIVLAYNGAAHLGECLESLVPLDQDCTLIIVDNGSQDDSLAIAQACAQSHERVIVLPQATNLGFSGGMNQGIAYAMAQDPACTTVTLVNQDAVALPGWHAALVAPFEDQSIAAVGSLVLDPSASEIRHVGGKILWPRAMTEHLGVGETDLERYSELIDVEYATGAALAIRAADLIACGLFDERYNPAYWEEIDLCTRLTRAGRRIVVNPEARVIHHEGTSISDHIVRSTLVNRNRLLFLFKTQPIEWLEAEFLPAETAYLDTYAGLYDTRALRRAYLIAMLLFQDWCAARAEFQQRTLEPKEIDRLRTLLATLRTDCIAKETQALAQLLA